MAFPDDNALETSERELPWLESHHGAGFADLTRVRFWKAFTPITRFNGNGDVTPAGLKNLNTSG